MEDYGLRYVMEANSHNRRLRELMTISVGCCYVMEANSHNRRLRELVTISEENNDFEQIIDSKIPTTPWAYACAKQRLFCLIIFIRKWYFNLKVITKNDKADMESDDENLEVDTQSISRQVQVPAQA